MQKFTEVAVTSNALAKRKSVYGVGINDCKYVVFYKRVDGVRLVCPYYDKWAHMLNRCYALKYHAKRQTYIGCTVAKEWLLFSNFRLWMEKQNWNGQQLDKDILSIGNKIYSPETCVFVSSRVNSILTDRSADRGKWPRGVNINKRTGRFVARCNMYGKAKHLGYFDNPIQASNAYIECKYKYILEVAETQVDIVKEGLVRHAKALLSTANQITA